ncbi:hypothetical protein [Actinoplanes sp. NPDC020271]|uniref:hypothetical protein n=1 Tax=Actinoplanes sp. NPDC020271 TaxID=3363896 RepID=UPI0037B6C318
MAPPARTALTLVRALNLDRDPGRAARLPRLTEVAVPRRAGRRDLEGRAVTIQQIGKQRQLAGPGRSGAPTPGSSGAWRW